MTKSILFSMFAMSLGLTACEGSIDSKKLAEGIEKEVKSKNVPVKAVTCPENIKIKKDGKFDCSIELSDGTKVVVNVVMKDEAGNVEWKTADAPAATSAKPSAAPAAATGDKPAEKKDEAAAPAGEKKDEEKKEEPKAE